MHNTDSQPHQAASPRTRKLLILRDSSANTGVGEVPGGEPIRRTLEDASTLVIGQPIGHYQRILQTVRAAAGRGLQNDRRPSLGNTMQALPQQPARRAARQLAGTALLALSLAAALPAVAAPLNPRGSSVQLFHWRWVDVATECRDWLGPQGYGGVQVAPPTAAQNGRNWYDIFQPVDYTDLNSKMGSRAQFLAMIQACHGAGVRVYIDAVINHLAAGRGVATNGAHWDAATLSYPRFSAQHFHPACAIERSDYGKPGKRQAVTDCRLSGLPDLDTAQPYVQAELQNYLNMLVELGVDGFRIDAAKHIAQPELQAIMDGVRHRTMLGERLWVTQEAIGDGSVDLGSYLSIGTINEFKYPHLLRAIFRNENGASLAQLPQLTGMPGHWGGSLGLVDSAHATVFVNNWDTERKGGSLNASNRSGEQNDTVGTRRYNLANILMLAWPYGEAQLHSGFNFHHKDDDAPSASPYDDKHQPRINQDWDFIHRWPDLSNMVALRAVAEGEGVDGFGIGSAQQIAFGRGAKAFVALNNDTTPWRQRFQTALPPGAYCNIIDGSLDAAGMHCSGEQVMVDAAGMVTLALPANNGERTPAVALHVGQRVGMPAARR